MNLSLPRLYSWTNTSSRPRLRSCHMRPSRKKMAQVSCQIHPSVPLDSHSPLSNFTLDFRTGRSISQAVLPISFKYTTLAAFQHKHWYLEHASDISAMMQFWMKATSALPYTDDVCGSVVTALLNIASNDRLSPHTPMVAWDWLNRRPVLPPECVALFSGTVKYALEKVQQLGDTKLVVSCLHIFWSEWRQLRTKGRFWGPWGHAFFEDIDIMRRLIREELGGIGAAGYRTDLVRRLDCILLRLEQGQGVPSAKGGYEELRRELLEMDEEATKILTGTSSSCHPFAYRFTCLCAGCHSTFMCALPLLCP